MTLTIKAFNMADYDLAELSNLWHISRVPCSDSAPNRYYRRMLWTAESYAKAHPEVTSTGAYKALDRMLS